MSLTHRQCTIEIVNESSYTLCNPSVHIFSGGCDTPLPSRLRPHESGSALFSKTAHTACGSVGVFTYDLQHQSTHQADRKIAVMFSVPYDFNLYFNWHAVGVFDKKTACDESLYNEMYYNAQKGFIRGKANGPTLTYRHDHVTIKSTMTDTYEPILKVNVSNV
ncbi:DELTA-sagatoxin-Srs1a-like [Archocentrus centrarchus]|uniref:DELTA-sagatoxin-Srs1a-like n=1 Tax=Archocentrus centrarchus TaxID=63155 RepID=UPI0011E9CAD5|nr:DELTA-sagatoxin-Srs1a-like [Archocentrus centrarchus]